MNIRHLIHACLCATAVLTATAQDRPVESAKLEALQDKANPGLPTLYLVGDSTMRTTAPKRGWGDELAPFFDTSKINVVNQAIGGRSSRTFQAEGRWDAALAKIQKGDFVIIQFGHNDGGAINEPPPITPKTRARGSIPGTGEETVEIDNILTKKHEAVHTFGWYMRKYVNDVLAKGATPIVFSLVPRNTWVDGKIVRTFKDTYQAWSEQTAKTTGALYVDHQEIIAEALEKVGQANDAYLYADVLHASPAGARFNAQLAVAGIRSLSNCDLKNYLSPAGLAIPAFVPQAGSHP